MLILKHLKALQHVSIIILIIFRELVGSLLKSLNLKFLTFKIINVDCGDAAALFTLIIQINLVVCFLLGNSRASGI
jgi:hypothetical protein